MAPRSVSSLSEREASPGGPGAGGPERALLAAGFLTWGIAGLPTLLPLVQAPATLRAPATIAWLAAYAGFGFAFWALAVREEAHPVRRVALLAAQSAAALATLALGRSDLTAVLLAVVAGEAPSILSGRRSLAWIAAQSAGLATVLYVRFGPRSALLTGAAYVGFQLFALGAAWLAQREREARRELARVNGELAAAHALLAESTRAAERLRISRELHDSLGHHLVALNLQLEVARNVVEGDGKDAVAQAAALGHALLGEVRGVVGAMRAEAPLDLRRALETLVSGVAGPRAHLSVADSAAAALDDPALAHALFRFVQEGLTNAVRHASARNLWIEVDATTGHLRASVRDDGKGSAVAPGNGIAGLRERFAELGGEVQVETSPGHGLTLRASLPLHQAGVIAPAVEAPPVERSR